MKPHFKPLVTILELLIYHSATAAIVTAGLEFAEGTPHGNVIVQCIDTNSALLGQWTVPELGWTLTNAISATATGTNAHIVVAALPYESAGLWVNGAKLATCDEHGDVIIAPAMRIGSVYADNGIADIDLRIMRKALCAWQPLKYGAFTNEYAGFTGTVTCVAEPKARTTGRGFASVNASELELEDLEGAIICAFVDTDGNGRWTAGELFGCSTLYATNPIPGVASTNSTMPWLYTTNAYLKAWPNIALTRTSPSMARYDLSPLLSGSTAVTTDRDVHGYITPNRLTNEVSSVSQFNALHLRVVRDGFNEDGDYLVTEPYYCEVVLDRTVNASLRPLFTEADLLAEGLYDLDWGTLTDAFHGSAIGSSSDADLRSVTYRVFVGNGDIVSPLDDTDILPVKFVNAFEATSVQSKTTPLTPSGTVDSGRPTFTWRHDNTIDKSYPAFRLRVWKANGTTLVYDSGVRRVPPRNAKGVYSWTAPLYANMVTAQGQVFATTNNYQWAVSMLDAKFTGFRIDETKKIFRLE